MGEDPGRPVALLSRETASSEQRRQGVRGQRDRRQRTEAGEKPAALRGIGAGEELRGRRKRDEPRRRRLPGQDRGHRDVAGAVDGDLRRPVEGKLCRKGAPVPRRREQGTSVGEGELVVR